MQHYQKSKRCWFLSGAATDEEYTNDPAFLSIITAQAVSLLNSKRGIEIRQNQGQRSSIPHWIVSLWND